MPSNFHEIFEAEEIELPSERSTGLVFAVVALVVAFFWRDVQVVLLTALFICMLFVGIAFLAPIVLRPLNILWFKFALLLNKIVSPVVMLVLFVITIVPVGLAMQIVRDPLRKSRPDDLESCWIECGEDKSSSMTNQF